MNILAELLPGARQLRAPLAIGYLWLTVAWINIPRLPDELTRSSLVSRAASELHHVSPVVIVVGLSFLAYLIGLFFEVIDEAVIKIAVGTATSAVGAIAILVLIVLVVFLWPITLPIAIALTALSFWRIRREKTSAFAELLQRLVNLSLHFIDYYYLTKDFFLRVWSNAYPVRQELISERMSHLLYRNPDVLDKFCETLKPMSLRVACHNAGISSENQTMISPDGQLLYMPDVAARLLIDKESERLLRIYLRDRLQSSEIRKTVVTRAMDAQEMRQLVDRALANADTWVRAERPHVFEACDRLRAEGEFRRAVALPLAAALVSTCSLYTSNIWVVIGIAAPAILIYFSGLRKEENAASIVAGCINAGVANFNLDVEDVRLLRWPTQQARVIKKRKRRLRSRVSIYDRRVDSRQVHRAGSREVDSPETTV